MGSRGHRVTMTSPTVSSPRDHVLPCDRDPCPRPLTPKAPCPSPWPPGCGNPRRAPSTRSTGITRCGSSPTGWASPTGWTGHPTSARSTTWTAWTTPCTPMTMTCRRAPSVSVGATLCPCPSPRGPGAHSVRVPCPRREPPAPAPAAAGRGDARRAVRGQRRVAVGGVHRRGPRDPRGPAHGCVKSGCGGEVSRRGHGVTSGRAAGVTLRDVRACRVVRGNLGIPRVPRHFLLTPPGSRVGTLEFPVSRVTSCCFGGADYADLFVTSAADGLSAEQLRGEPQAGHVFKVGEVGSRVQSGGGGAACPSMPHGCGGGPELWEFPA